MNKNYEWVVNFNGKSYGILESAREDSLYSEFTAPAEDSEGRPYTAKWYEKPEWVNAKEVVSGIEDFDNMTETQQAAVILMEDDSNACNWNSPVEMVPEY